MHQFKPTRKPHRPLDDIAAELSVVLRNLGEDQATVAKKTKISQSTVSRILNGRHARLSKAVINLCKYANVNYSQGPLDPRSHAGLMTALSETWDGTEDHATALARVITSLKHFKRR